MSTPQTIAVTGASGHIGNVVCRLLLQKGYKVKAQFHQFKESIESLPLEMVQGDVLNNEDLRQLITGCEAVINCAGIISIHGDPKGTVFCTNTMGPKNVLEVSTELAVKKIVHISSTHAVHELPHSEPFSEDRPYKTAHDYAYDYSKAAGEQIMLGQTGENKPAVVIIRPSSVVGPYDFKPSEMGKALLDFYYEKISVLPEGGYNFVDVRDVAKTIITALETNHHGNIFLTTGKYHTLKDIAAVVHNLTGKKVPKRIISHRTLKTLLPLISLYAKISGAAPLYSIDSIDALRNGHPGMDNSRAIAALGHCCRPLAESIRDFYTWYFATDKNISRWI